MEDNFPFNKILSLTPSAIDSLQLLEIRFVTE